MRRYNVYNKKMEKTNLRVEASNAENAIRIAKEHGILHAAVVECNERGDEINEVLDRWYWNQGLVRH